MTTHCCPIYLEIIKLIYSQNHQMDRCWKVTLQRSPAIRGKQWKKYLRRWTVLICDNTYLFIVGLKKERNKILLPVVYWYHSFLFVSKYMAGDLLIKSCILLQLPSFIISCHDFYTIVQKELRIIIQLLLR